MIFRAFYGSTDRMEFKTDGLDTKDDFEWIPYEYDKNIQCSASSIRPENLITLLIVFIMISTSKLMSADFKDETNPTVQEVVNKSTETESPTHSEEMSSEELASQYLDELGLSEGENGDLFIAIGSSQMPEEDPATNPDFITLRELKANEAALEAKRMFIE